MKLEVINFNSDKKESFEISDNFFVDKPNKNVIQDIVNWQTNHLKPRNYWIYC